jgi:2-hydroxy-3-oxopropionate reductase
MKIGFIGLGIMGKPMALNLKNAGHELFVPERKSLAPEIRDAATVCPNAKAVAEHAEALIIIVPDTPDVGEVLFGVNGAAEGLKKGSIVIDMSSISPIETKEYAEKITAKGCDYVDAPVSGGEVGAKNAALTIMAGGTDAGFARAKPLFEVMGKNITHVGPIGAGQVCKVANQIIVAKAGADPAKVRQALMGGFATSRILELHAERMINGTFNPGFKIKLHQKDLNLALSSAKALSLSLPNTAIAQQMFSSVIAHGGAELDHSALITAIEGMAGHTIRDKS